MDIQLTITFVILIVALILFFTDKIPGDLTALLTVVAFGLTGVLTPQEAFSGFSRAAVITIIAIFIIAEALRRSGVSEQVGNILLRVGGKSERRLVLTTMASAAFLSLFMNNIAAAAVLLPAVSGAAQKSRVSISKLMMPLAFGTTLGGMATLLTTANIILSSMLQDNNLQGFGLLDFAPVGLPLAIIGITYVTFFGRNALSVGSSMLERTHAPDAGQTNDLIETYHLDRKLFRARVPKNSFLIGKKLSECTLREDFSVSIVAIERKGKRLLTISAETEINDRDILILEGDEEDFRARDVKPYMEFLPATEWHEEDLESRAAVVIEAIVAPRSRLIDQTLRTSHFREKYGLNVLAIWRGDQEFFINLPEIPLQFGDALLLQGPREKLSVVRDNQDLIVLLSKENQEITVPNKGRAAIAIIVATLVFAAIYPHLTGPIMLAGAVAMMLTGIVTTEQAYASIGWTSVFLVAGLLPMGIALTKTNAAGIMASVIVSTIGPWGHLALLCGVFLTTMAIVQAMNGAAAAAIIGPVAIQMATQAGIDPRSMVMGVAIAASMAFLTPLSHPVNIMVMSPGGYGFRDYAKIGIPLSVILFVAAMILLPLVWRF
jgi:di/tricarboxylate transporter